MVISQIYGAGGNNGALYNADYIELLNAGTAAVDLSSWSVQYAATQGTSWQRTNLTGSIQPGHYYLIKESEGTNGTALPAADVTAAIAMAAGAGKVALLNNQTLIASGTACPTGAGVADLVGYGSGTNCFEGAGPTGTISTILAAFRAGDGCTDSNNNGADFATATPSPRNSSTAAHLCGGAPAPLTITTSTVLPNGVVGQPYSVTFAASGGTGGYAFSLLSGTLPPVMVLNGANLTGTPTTTTGSPFLFTIRVVDSASSMAIKQFALTITATQTCAPTNTIAQIQGNGATSPLITAASPRPVIVTSGIVTGRKSNGFFLQMPAPGDSDPATSDGIFVFTSSAPSAAAAVGNSVCVAGTLQEFIPDLPNGPSQTEISSVTSVTSLSVNNALPAPVVLGTPDTNPAGDLLQLERYEGMRVQVNSLTVAGPTRGTVNEANATSTSAGIFYAVITGTARPFREPGVQLPDPLPAGSPCCVPRWDANPEILSVNSLGLTGGTALDVAVGAVVTNVVGPLDYADRAYTIDIDPASQPAVTNNSPTYTPVAPPTSDEVTIGTFNMERFFDTTNDPSVDDVALTAAAFQNRLNKASLAIRNVMRSPDVLGVEEMENLATMQALANKVNQDAVAAGGPNPGYRAYLAEGNDIGGIDVGFLVKSGKISVLDVTQVGKDTTFTEPGGTTALLNDRPPLVLRATVTRNRFFQSQPFTVIVNHLRSLTSIDDATDGPRVRAKREAQAEFLAHYIQSLQTADPALNLVSVGDYNAFQFNDGYVDVLGVIKGAPASVNDVVVAGPAITSPALTDLVDTLPATQRYSYSFSGSAQVLDHVLVNPNMLSHLTRFAYARNDADFPEVYRNDANRPERISDHDMGVAYFTLPLHFAPSRR